MSQKKDQFAEILFADLGFQMMYDVERVLYDKQTDQQRLVLFEHKYFGKILMLDGATQITSRDEFIYQEMMAHVPLFAHGCAKHVLIIGGGDCGIAKRVLMHPEVEHLAQVEIDVAVVEFSREHFPDLTTPVFADKRFENIINDGAKYVRETENRFDVIIVDSTDPQGPGEVLFTYEFYAACKRCMKTGGVMVTQNGVPFLQPSELVSSVKHFRRQFRDGHCYVASIPTYVGGHMAIGWATDHVRLRKLSIETIQRRYKNAGSFLTKYWTPEVHVAAFALPRFIGDAIG